MSYSEADWIIPGVRSTCCDAPVLLNDICTKCHDHCGTRDSFPQPVYCAPCDIEHAGVAIDSSSIQQRFNGLYGDQCPRVVVSARHLLPAFMFKTAEIVFGHNI